MQVPAPEQGWKASERCSCAGFFLQERRALTLNRLMFFARHWLGSFMDISSLNLNEKKISRRCCCCFIDETMTFHWGWVTCLKLCRWWLMGPALQPVCLFKFIFILCYWGLNQGLCTVLHSWHFFLFILRVGFTNSLCYPGWAPIRDPAPSFSQSAVITGVLPPCPACPFILRHLVLGCYSRIATVRRSCLSSMGG